MKKGFDFEPIYNEKYLKNKTKSYARKTNTSFHDNGIPKEGFLSICLSVISIDSFFRIGRSYHPQLFQTNINNCHKKKITRYINDNLEISSDDSEQEAPDEKVHKE